MLQILEQRKKVFGGGNRWRPPRANRLSKPRPSMFAAMWTGNPLDPLRPCRRRRRRLIRSGHSHIGLNRFRIQTLEWLLIRALGRSARSSAQANSSLFKPTTCCSGSDQFRHSKRSLRPNSTRIRRFSFAAKIAAAAGHFLNSPRPPDHLPGGRLLTVHQLESIR